MNGFFKFVAVSGVGFLVDIALALSIHERLGLALWLAATISFFAVAALNYLVFEFWIFKDTKQRFSWARLVGVLMASGVAAGARIGTILGLTSLYTAILAEGRVLNLALLVSGGVISVVVNFVLNKKLVFARKL